MEIVVARQEDAGPRAHDTTGMAFPATQATPSEDPVSEGSHPADTSSKTITKSGMDAAAQAEFDKIHLPMLTIVIAVR